jgi:crotonobetainyl-CoA:carnitine CoA-transferase CaiB-like acyl-CoA transferase
MLKPRRKPPKVYPNADRFGEDGRRLYSAYDATTARSTRQVWVKRMRLAAIVVALVAAVLVVAVCSVLPH